MVVPLGPAKFYGSSLPRPRIYDDPKFSSERIDPPPSVSESFLKWANDAHWSMGGLSSTRKRMQGKIEGSVKKLRSEEEEKGDAISVAIEPPPAITPQTESHTAVEGGSLSFTRDSNPKSPHKRSPRVQRKLDDALEQHASHSQKKSRVTKRNLGNDLELLDLATVAEGRTSPVEEGKCQPAAAGIDPVPFGGSGGSVRRSSRLSAPVTVSGGSKKVGKRVSAAR